MPHPVPVTPAPVRPVPSTLAPSTLAPRAARALLPVALLMASALPAAEADPHAQALDAAMEMMRVYLTCSVLDPETHGFVVEYWSRMVEETLQHLQDHALAPANLPAFAASADPEALMPAPSTPFAEVRAFCAAHADWMAQLSAFDLPQLPQSLDTLDAADED